MRINKFFLLARKEKKFISIYCLIWKVRIRLWFSSYKKTRIWCAQKVNNKYLHHQSQDTFGRKFLLNAVNITSNYVPKATCLTKALAADTVLKQSQFESHLFVGIKRNDDNYFESHAWLQDDKDIIFGGDFSTSFKPILIEKYSTTS